MRSRASPQIEGVPLAVLGPRQLGHLAPLVGLHLGIALLRLVRPVLALPDSTEHVIGRREPGPIRKLPLQPKQCRQVHPAPPPYSYFNTKDNMRDVASQTAATPYAPD